MKKLFIIFAVVLFTVGFATKVSAQVTVNNNAGGEIMAPITLVAETSLEFGRLAVQAATGGTVVLTPAASTAASTTGGVTLMSGGLTTRRAAKYNVGGEVGYGYSIKVPDDGVVTIKNASDITMAISTFTFLSSNPTPTGGTLNGGTDVFYVGATLIVGPAQATGIYSGTYDVIVNYN